MDEHTPRSTDSDDPSGQPPADQHASMPADSPEAQPATPPEPGADPGELPPPLPPAAADRAETGPAVPRADDAGLAERLQPYLAPLLRQWKLNLGVWLPWLSSSSQRARLVQYRVRDAKEGDLWSVELPARCWKTGSTDGLLKRGYERDVRTFDSAPSILLVGAIAILALIVLAVFTWPLQCLVLAVLCVPLVVGVLYARSSTETVHLTIYTSPEAADDLACPDIVLYENELYVYLPTEQLAEAAHGELLVRRREGKKYQARMPVAGSAPAAGGSGSTVDPMLKPSAEETAPAQSAPGSEAAGGRFTPRTFKRDDLPPIKLDE